MPASKKRALKPKAPKKRRPTGRTTVPRQETDLLASLPGFHRDILDHVPQNVYCIDLKGRVTYANKLYCKTIGKPLKRILGKTGYDFFPKALADKYARDDRRVIRTGETLEIEEVNQSPRREAVYVRVVKTPLRDRRGKVVGVQGTFWDVTSQRRVAAQTAEQAQILRTLLDTVPDYIYFKDLRSRFILNSRAHLGLLGLTDQADAVGKTDLNFFVRERATQFRRDEMEVLRTGRAIVGKEEKAARPGGKVVWNSTTKMPWRDAEGRIAGTMGISRDITDRKQTEDLLYRRAFYDPLTELPNRALFMDRLAYFFHRAERNPEKHFAVLFLDLDRFKSVNDSLGHEAGDALLIATAQKLKGCLRPGDTVARLGGDEFTVLLEEVHGIADAVRVAKRILESLAEPVPVKGTEVFSTVSIGVALSSSAYKRPEDLLRDADTAMYGAKAHGRSRYEVFDRAMHDRAVMLLETETDLRRALDRGEFCIHYQPVVRLEDRRVLGFEALVRWNHPQRGLLLPDQFIALAEELGLLGPIGLWVLREACRRTRDWQKRYPADPPLRIGVNVSSRQLQQKGFLDQVRQTLKETGLAPDSLTLEVTEKTLLENLKSTAAVLAQLRRLNIQVHIDDFGTDYLLLQRLGQYPADTLKIDPSFVRNIGTDAVHAEVMSTIVRLAQSLGMKVMAEGVETDAQLRGLRDADCGSAQGFLFSKAVEAAAAEAFLRHGGVFDKRALSKKKAT